MAKGKIRDYELYIEDILNAIKKIKRYTHKISFKNFCKDEKTVDAVIRNFEVIGEAVRQLSPDIKSKHPEIEWKVMINFRNVIIHEYFGIDLEIMWDIIETKLNILEKKIRNIFLGTLERICNKLETNIERGERWLKKSRKSKK